MVAFSTRSLKRIKTSCISGFLSAVIGPAHAATETVLYSFTFADGAGPNACLVKLHGTLYGTTSEGGPYGNNAGTVFSITKTGTEKLLFANADNPLGGLIDVGGTLYGTSAGGSTGYGTVFKVTTAGTLLLQGGKRWG